jgi:hypothetical protein
MKSDFASWEIFPPAVIEILAVAEEKALCKGSYTEEVLICVTAWKLLIFAEV